MPRRLRLQRFFSTFPDRWPGIGLVFLRIAIAGGDLVVGLEMFSLAQRQLVLARIIGVADFAVAALLLAGFLTLVAGALSTIQNLASLVIVFISANAALDSVKLSAELLFISVAIVLLGPGAFSIDANLFGPREIIIPHRGESTHE